MRTSVERTFIQRKNAVSSSTDRAAAIQDAAHTLFARRGYGATSMRAIAKAADVSIGLAYNYFGGKQDLLHAIVHDGIEQVHTSLAELDATGSPVDRLRAFVTTSLHLVHDHRDFWRLLYSLRHQPEALAAVRDDVDALYGTVHTRLQSISTALGSDAPALDARLLFACIDGAGQHYVRTPATYPLDDTADRIVARFTAPID